MLEQQELIIVVLGLIASGALIVIAYLGRKQAEIAAIVTPLAELAFRQADTVLANYGPQLLPAHEIISGVEGFIDEDTDALVKALPPEAVRALRVLLDRAERLTDAEVEETAPEQEHFPDGDPRVEITAQESQ